MNCKKQKFFLLSLVFFFSSVAGAYETDPYKKSLEQIKSQLSDLNPFQEEVYFNEILKDASMQFADPKNPGVASKEKVREALTYHAMMNKLASLHPAQKRFRTSRINCEKIPSIQADLNRMEKAMNDFHLHRGFEMEPSKQYPALIQQQFICNGKDSVDYFYQAQLENSINLRIPLNLNAQEVELQNQIGLRLASEWRMNSMKNVSSAAYVARTNEMETGLEIRLETPGSIDHVLKFKQLLDQHFGKDKVVFSEISAQVTKYWVKDFKSDQDFKLDPSNWVKRSPGSYQFSGE